MAKGKDIIMYFYVVDENDKLLGVAYIRDILKADDNYLLPDLRWSGKICLLTSTAQEKQALKNILEENLIIFHLNLAKNIREEFGVWSGNEELIKSCGVINPDDASMAIVKAVWKVLNRQPWNTI